MCYSYVVGDSQHPLVVHGPRGCGKTTLLARAAQCCHTWQPEALLLVRFVSISAQSHTTEQLVRSIVDQCSVLTYGHQSWAVHVSSYTVSCICHLNDVNKRQVYQFCMLFSFLSYVYMEQSIHIFRTALWHPQEQDIYYTLICHF